MNPLSFADGPTEAHTTSDWALERDRRHAERVRLSSLDETPEGVRHTLYRLAAAGEVSVDAACGVGRLATCAARGERLPDEVKALLRASLAVLL